MEHKEMTEASILFVDDEEVIRQSLVRELRMEHFTITSVSSGSEAINALRDTQFDVVITDQKLPLFVADADPLVTITGLLPPFVDRFAIHSISYLSPLIFSTMRS